MEADEGDEYRAVCAPERPLAWRNPLVFAHLVKIAKSGRMVVAKAASLPGAFSLPANGGRPSEQFDYFLGAVPMMRATEWNMARLCEGVVFSGHSVGSEAVLWTALHT
jgi:hypothetical protein